MRDALERPSLAAKAQNGLSLEVEQLLFGQRGRMAQVSAGVFRLDSQLLVILNIDRVLHVGAQIKAA